MLTVSPCYYICDLSLTSLIAQLVKNPPAMRGDPVLILGSRRSPGEGIGYPLQYSWVSLVAQLVKNTPAVGETWAQSLGWEDPLEKGKATHSSLLTWRIPGGRKVIGHDWATFTFTLPIIDFFPRWQIQPRLRFMLSQRSHCQTMAHLRYSLHLNHVGRLFYMHIPRTCPQRFFHYKSTERFRNMCL